MRIYLTPILKESKSPTQNPYIKDLINALENNGHTIVNKNRPSNIGLFDILFYLNKVDAIYFNWIEDLVATRLGILQTIYVYLSCFIFKLFNKKIIWTLHNKISHSKDYLFLKMINTYMLLNYSDLVITHSSDGLEFSKQFLKDESNNIHFIHHPIHNNLGRYQDIQVEKKYDILIWGAISPYKNVDVFLEYLEKKDLLNKYNICILGKISNKILEDKIMKYKSEKIKIINKFVDDNLLEKYINISKIILFTYSPGNTFASGSLMYSLSYGSNIIGPNVGSFKDLEDENLIHTFNNFHHLIKVINIAFSEKISENKKLLEFIENNNWDYFGKKISKYIKEKE